MHKVQGHGQMQDPLYIFDLLALSCAQVQGRRTRNDGIITLTGCVNKLFVDYLDIFPGFPLVNFMK